MVYGGEAGRYEGDVGVGAFGRGGADGLVGTAGAGGAGAGEVGGGAGTVFGFGGDEGRGVFEGGGEVDLDGGFDGGGGGCWHDVLLVEWCVAWMDWLFYDLLGRVVWMDFPLKIMHAACLSGCMAMEGWEDFDR